MRRSVLAVTGVVAAIGMGSEAGSAQGVPRLVRDAALDEGFGLVNRVRELPDGRLVVADPLSKTLQVVDLAKGRVEPFGREGQGPEEYRQPDAVYALPGGRSLLVDLGNARLTELGADLRFGETHPMATGTPGPGGNFEPRIPAGADGQGRIYYQTVGLAPGGALPTHAKVKRWDLATGEIVELGEAQLPAREDRSSGGPNAQQRMVRQIPLSAADGWAVGADGRVALVRMGEPYRVDWIDPDGTVHPGTPVPYDPIPIRTADKNEWVQTSAQRGGGIGISVEMNNSQVRTSFARGGGLGAEADINDYTWPETKPAFDPGDVLVDPSGRAWVRRYRRAGEPPLYDVFDASGKRIGSVELEPARRLVGFGNGTAYVIRFDEMDLQYIERYRLQG
ncbi:MAG: hypothetical protein R3E10_08135 [Gemmatimonadota bacterium]